jgi:hypothetical protein
MGTAHAPRASGARSDIERKQLLSSNSEYGISPKIFQSKALVRFSRCRAAQEAAREEYWI